MFTVRVYQDRTKWIRKIVVDVCTSSTTSTMVRLRMFGPIFNVHSRLCSFPRRLRRKIHKAKALAELLTDVEGAK